MSISPYLGMLVGGALEAAGYITGSLLITKRLGRKGSFTVVATLTIMCVILIPIVSNHNPIATVCIAHVGKFAISSTVAVSGIYAPELFPTTIRSGANGIFVACSRIGAILPPIIDTSINKVYLPYTFYASAGLAFIVILLLSFLPETKSKSMDDEEDYGKDRTVP
ncbi:unnamed protein product [Rotaria magnacalcarata]|nr:unnamed protein product [Rotaria magnacalcarata]